MLPIFLLILLTGCTTAGDWLSDSAARHDSAIAYPKKLEQIQIGVTTKDQVRNLLGNPTDIQLSSDHNQASESWGYAKGNPSIHPLQYVPGFGVFALSKQPRPSSFSISFSPEGIVDGIVLRDVQPFGNSGASREVSGTPSEVTPYGTNNPLTHQPRPDVYVDSGIAGK